MGYPRKKIVTRVTYSWMGLARTSKTDAVAGMVCSWMGPADSFKNSGSVGLFLDGPASLSKNRCRSGLLLDGLGKPIQKPQQQHMEQLGQQQRARAATTSGNSDTRSK